MQYYTTYTEAELDPMVRKLAYIVKDAPISKLKAVHNKYKQQKQNYIALNRELISTDALERIIAAV